MRSQGMIRCLPAIATCLLLLSCTSLANEPANALAKMRRYADGPLTAADFVAPVPRNRNIGGNIIADAFTTAEIRVDFRYSYQFRGNSATAKIDRIEFFAIVRPGKSWNVRPNDKKLMDHEQGHFDIAQELVLKAKRELFEQARAGKSIQATAARAEDAVEKVKRSVQSMLTRYTDAMRRRNLEYDRLTRNGQVAGEQAKHRARQIANIKYLTEMLEKNAAGGS